MCGAFPGEGRTYACEETGHQAGEPDAQWSAGWRAARADCAKEKGVKVAKKMRLNFPTLPEIQLYV